jgi:hypothetical protein
MRVIKLSKAEQENRMADPDWCYIDPKEFKKRMATFRKGIKKSNSKLITITSPDNDNTDFKKLWQ